MISAEAFAIANLIIWTALLVVFGFVERRGLTSFEARHRGVRYRRMSTAKALALLRRSDRRRLKLAGKHDDDRSIKPQDKRSR